MNWHEHFTYNPETGDLVRKIRMCSHGQRNPIPKGPAGTRQFRKNNIPHCIRVRLFDRFYVAHRIVWEMHRGQIPFGKVIDHINGNPFDNRLCNLRLASPRENARNKKMHHSNRYGYKGIRLLPSGKWQARIRADGMLLSLGTSDTKEGAYAIYAGASVKHHGEFGRV